MSKLSTNEQIIKEQTEYVIKNQLPPFALKFFRALKTSMTNTSLLAYARDLATFFYFLQDNNSIDESHMSVHDFEKLSAADLDEYMEFSYTCEVAGKQKDRSVDAIRRRYAVLKAFYY